MPAKSNFKKQLREIKKTPQRLFIIGVRSVFEPDEYYAYNRIEPFFSDLMRYVDRNEGFTSESISHIEFYRLSNGEDADLLYFGSSLVVNLFSHLREIGIQIEKIFDPDPDEKYLLNGVTYQFLDLSQTTSDTNLTGEDGTEKEIEEFDPEVYAQKIEEIRKSDPTAYTEETHLAKSLPNAGWKLAKRTVRRKNIFGIVEKSTMPVPCIETTENLDGEVLRWVCEISVPNIAASILEYADLNGLFSKPSKRAPSQSVQANLELLDYYEKYAKSLAKRYRNVDAWLRSKDGPTKEAQIVIDRVFRIYSKRHRVDGLKDSERSRHQVEAIKLALNAARRFRSGQKKV